MNFDCREHPLTDNDQVSEFWQSEEMRNILSKYTSDTAVFIVLIYYDDFKKFKWVTGGCGALYFTLLNFNRQYMSKLKSIFPLALLNTEEEYLLAMQHVVKELIELHKYHTIHFAGANGQIKCAVHLGINSVDHLQRTISCAMSSPISQKASCCSCHCTQEDIVKPPSVTTGDNGVNLTNKRTVAYMKEGYEQYNQATTQVDKNKILSTYGLRLFEYGGDKEPVRRYTNPFWTLFDQLQIDIHDISPVDYFHVEILGLLRKHFKLLYETVFTEAQRTELDRIVGTYKVNNKKLPSLKGYKYWNGEVWLQLFSVAPFALNSFFNTNKIPNWFQHLDCWNLHSLYVTKLVQASLSFAEIDHAKSVCLKWRQLMIDLYAEEKYGRKKFHFPNFHSILHVFDQAKRFGPPVLYWTRPFEHKHTVFRQFIQQSNKKNVEKWSIEREILIENTKYLFAEAVNIRIPSVKNGSKKLKVEDKIVFRNENNEKKYGSVIEVMQDGAVKLLEWNVPLNCSTRTKCTKFELSFITEGRVVVVHRRQLIHRFTITDKYINRYSVLEISKL